MQNHAVASKSDYNITNQLYHTPSQSQLFSFKLLFFPHIFYLGQYHIFPSSIFLDKNRSTHPSHCPAHSKYQQNITCFGFLFKDSQWTIFIVILMQKMGKSLLTFVLAIYLKTTKKTVPILPGQLPKIFLHYYTIMKQVGTQQRHHTQHMKNMIKSYKELIPSIPKFERFCSDHQGLSKQTISDEDSSQLDKDCSFGKQLFEDDKHDKYFHSLKTSSLYFEKGKNFGFSEKIFERYSSSKEHFCTQCKKKVNLINKDYLKFEIEGLLEKIQQLIFEKQIIKSYISDYIKIQQKELFTKLKDDFHSCLQQMLSIRQNYYISKIKKQRQMYKELIQASQKLGYEKRMKQTEEKESKEQEISRKLLIQNNKLKEFIIYLQQKQNMTKIQPFSPQKSVTSSKSPSSKGYSPRKLETREEDTGTKLQNLKNKIKEIKTELFASVQYQRK